jgi:hypothetical protein
MGYSKNISTLRSMADQLQLLAAGQACRWERPGEDADKWAYKIRECMQIAVRLTKKNDPQLEDWMKNLAAAKSAFAIRVISPTLVEASFKTDMELSAEPTPVVQGMQPAGRSHLIGEVKTLEDMQAVWKHAQPTNDPIHFPNCLLSDQELSLAADWADRLKPSWMLLKPRNTRDVTLAPNDPRVPAEAKVKGSGAGAATGRLTLNNLEGV